jgi:capsule polysaccharide modification protein KpsS
MRFVPSKLAYVHSLNLDVVLSEALGVLVVRQAAPVWS